MKISTVGKLKEFLSKYDDDTLIFTCIPDGQCGDHYRCGYYARQEKIDGYYNGRTDIEHCSECPHYEYCEDRREFFDAEIVDDNDGTIVINLYNEEE